MKMQSSNVLPQPALGPLPADANEVSIDDATSTFYNSHAWSPSEQPADYNFDWFRLSSGSAGTLVSQGGDEHRYYFQKLDSTVDLTQEFADPADPDAYPTPNQSPEIDQTQSAQQTAKRPSRLRKKNYPRSLSTEEPLNNRKMSSTSLTSLRSPHKLSGGSSPDLKQATRLRQLSSPTRAQPPKELHPAFRDEARQIADSLVPAPIDTSGQTLEHSIDREYKPEQIHRDARDTPPSPDRSTAKGGKRSLIPNLRNRARSRSRERSDRSSNPRAWVAGHPNKLTYDLQPLFSTAPVTELWDEHGDTAVFLFPKSTGKGPCFKLKSSLFAASKTLTDLTISDFSNESAHSPERKRSGDSHSSRHPSLDGTTLKELYVPLLSGSGAFSSHVGSQKVSETKHLSDDDIEALVSVRNLFAFLVGQSLVATERHSSIFWTFLKVIESLKIYGFCGVDGTSYGEVAVRSFDCYMEELNLGDVRGSREKTIEALVLGERMQSVPLYNEAFVHAAGKYAEISEIAQQSGPGTKFEMLSSTTKLRLERASFDLNVRIRNVDSKLHDFDFPSLWTGLLHSKDERKAVPIARWKETFIATRKHVINFYKQVYGSWPPNAKNKKNNLETSGLNRLVLKALYRDFSLLYDLWVDRTFSSTRHGETSTHEGGPLIAADSEPVSRVLRRLFDGYNRSSPPVIPSIPYGTPILPLSNPVIMATYHENDRSRRLDKSELDSILDQSCNRDTLVSMLQSPFPFLDSMRSFERSHAVGSSLNDLQDLRVGMWIFLYVVLQALPLLVEDTPGVHYKRGVEYFLCEPVRSPPPWALPTSPNIAAAGAMRPRHSPKASIGSIRGAPDNLEHSVDNVYQSSHCWLRAAEWEGRAPKDMKETPKDTKETKEARRTSAPLRLVPPTQPEPARQRAKSLVMASPAQDANTQTEMAQSEALDLAIATMSLPMYDPTFSGDTFGEAVELSGDSPTTQDNHELASLESTPISPPSAVERSDSDNSVESRPSLQSIDRTMSWAYSEADGPVHYPGDGPSVIVGYADEEENPNCRKSGEKFYFFADMNSSSATLRRADGSRSRSHSRERSASSLSPAPEPQAPNSAPPAPLLPAIAFQDGRHRLVQSPDSMDKMTKPSMSFSNSSKGLREQKSLPALPVNDIHVSPGATPHASLLRQRPAHANTLMPGASFGTLAPHQSYHPGVPATRPLPHRRSHSAQDVPGREKKPLTFEEIFASMHADDPTHQADAQLDKRGRGILRRS